MKWIDSPQTSPYGGYTGVFLDADEMVEWFIREEGAETICCGYAIKKKRLPYNEFSEQFTGDMTDSDFLK